MSLLQRGTIALSQVGAIRQGVISEDEFFNNLYDISSTLVRTNKKIYYYNVPASFDIETSSFLYEGNKTAIMYEWTFGIYGWVVYGRTWEEFKKFYEKLVKTFLLSETRRLVVYVHNLDFEFQFMRKRFSWLKVFSLEERKPVYALTMEGVEFRCSYKLSGYSLANLSNQLQKYKVKKLVGDLDYYKLRHSKTVLTPEELQYCINDVLVVNAYIQELIEHNGDITKIPLTKTGFVRNRCRNACMRDKKTKYSKKYTSYRKLMRSLQLDSETYLQLKQAFAGGFTHASPLYVFDTVKNVRSYDFTSSYPFVMVSEKFPMSSPKNVELTNDDDLEYYLEHYCCLFDIEFINLQPKVYYENYLSLSHCRHVENAVTSNGRIVSASHCVTTLTEVDYNIIRNFYTWDDAFIDHFKIFEMGYLPTDFVKSILDMYVSKTSLKGVAGKESEYMRSKEDVNSAYGMCVTDICREEILCDGETWDSKAPDIEDAIERNNKSVKRFLYYPWGVWVTAYARANLFTGIMEFGEDYLYSDTDSIKVMNYENHLKYITEYNEWVLYKLRKAMEYHHLDISLTAPKNIRGEVKQLGVWTDEGLYTRFKSLGAKRYLTETYDEVQKRFYISLTVSGINKKACIPYLLNKYGREKIFDIFNEDLSIPAETTMTIEGKEVIVRPTGKLTHTYVDTEVSGKIEDYNGVIADFDELSGVHMEPAGYDFSITTEFIKFVEGVKSQR